MTKQHGSQDDSQPFPSHPHISGFSHKPSPSGRELHSALCLAETHSTGHLLVPSERLHTFSSPFFSLLGFLNTTLLLQVYLGHSAHTTRTPDRSPELSPLFNPISQLLHCEVHHVQAQLGGFSAYQLPCHQQFPYSRLRFHQFSQCYTHSSRTWQ